MRWPRSDLEVHAAIHHGLAVRVVNVLERHDALAAARGCGKAELDRLRFVHGRFDLVHALDLLEFRLRLRGFAGLGAEPVGELLQPLDVALLVLVGRQMLFRLRRALDEIFVVVAAISQQPALTDVHDAADELVQELAVVRDEHDGAGIRFQIFLKPPQRFEVEMVGRLVEQQQVRLLHEQPGQIRPHHPAAAHRLQRTIEIPFAKRQPVQDVLRFRFELISAQFVEPRLHLVEIVRLRVVPGLERLQPPLQLRDLRRDRRRQLQHRFLADRRRFLRQMTERRVAFDVHLAGVRRVVTQHEREQRGLPCPIRPDQPNPVAAIDLQRRVFKQNARSKRLGHMRNRQHGRSQGTGWSRPRQGGKQQGERSPSQCLNELHQRRGSDKAFIEHAQSFVSEPPKIGRLIVVPVTNRISIEGCYSAPVILFIFRIELERVWFSRALVKPFFCNHKVVVNDFLRVCSLINCFAYFSVISVNVVVQVD